MSEKRGLLNVIKNYKGKQESFCNKVNEILKNEASTPKAAEKRVNELSLSFEAVARNLNDRAIRILDRGVEALEKKWRDNSTGKLKDLSYQRGLANTIKMIETGEIANKEDFKKIIEVYKDDYNALETIRNILDTDINKRDLLMLVPKDNREYNKKALNELRDNIERYINPYSIKDSLTINLQGMIDFINTRLKDDLSIIPWEEV